MPWTGVVVREEFERALELDPVGGYSLFCMGAPASSVASQYRTTFVYNHRFESDISFFRESRFARVVVSFKFIFGYWFVQ